MQIMRYLFQRDEGLEEEEPLLMHFGIKETIKSLLKEMDVGTIMLS